MQTNVIGWVATMKKPFLSPHIKHDSRFSKGLFDDEVVQSVMCVPLQSGGLTVGYFLALNKNGNNKFAEYDLRLFEKMAAITAPFLNSAQEIREYFNAPLPEIALVSKYESAGLLGKSQRFIELLRAIEAAARCDVRVLLEGQSGTGKELVARAIHKFSSRKEKRFVAIDCGAIPERCPAHCYRLSRKKQIQVRADWGGSQSRSGDIFVLRMMLILKSWFLTRSMCGRPNLSAQNSQNGPGKTCPKIL